MLNRPHGDAAMRGDRLRVLVVDDEDSILRALEITLRRAGYDVECVLRGETALARLRAERVDILVLDLRIPDERGDTLFHHAVGLQPHLRHATVFMTGDITEIAQTLIAACRCPCVMKPFELAEVLDAIAAASPVRVQNVPA